MQFFHEKFCRKKFSPYLCITKQKWWIHLRARIRASHARHRGSNPLSTTKAEQTTISRLLLFCANGLCASPRHCLKPKQSATRSAFGAKRHCSQGKGVEPIEHIYCSTYGLRYEESALRLRRSNPLSTTKEQKNIRSAYRTPYIFCFF